MAFLGGEIRTDDMPVGDRFDPLPSGWYQAMVTKTEGKDTKNGGWYVQITFDILGPTNAGRKIWSNLNLKNNNADAVRIAQQHLGDINRALGMASIKDTDEWLGKTLEIKLVVRRDEQYGDKNDVKEYRATLGSSVHVSPSPSIGTPVQNQPAKAATGKMPWQK